MNKKILAGSIGAVFILIMVTITPVVISQATKKIKETKDEECSICPYVEQYRSFVKDDGLFSKPIICILCIFFLTIATIIHGPTVPSPVDCQYLPACQSPS